MIKTTNKNIIIKKINAKIPYFSFLKLNFEIYHLNTSKNFYGFFLFCILVFLSLNLYINFRKVTKKYIKK